IDAATPIVADRLSELAAVDGAANNAAVNSNAGVHLWRLVMAHPLHPQSSLSPDPFLRWASTPSVFVCHAGTDHVAAKLVECLIRIQVRVLIIERQKQIAPDFIIE